MPFTSPTWNLPGFYSFEVDFAEREEWFSQNTSAVLPSGAFHFSRRRTASITRRNQKFPSAGNRLIPSISVRLLFVAVIPKRSCSSLVGDLARFLAALSDNCRFRSGFKGTQHRRGTRYGNPNLQPEVAYEWTYGTVYNPKWIKGLTLTADWWHIDMRSIASLLGAQFVVDNNLPGLVIREPSTTPGTPRPIILVIDPNENLTGAIFEGLDYEAIYILDSSILGDGDLAG